MSTTELIAADLFLLLTGETGRPYKTQVRRQALVAAAVADLRDRGLVEIGGGRNPQVSAPALGRAEHPALAVVQGAIRKKGPRAMSRTVQDRKADPTGQITRAFEAQGVIERRGGIFGATWPTRDPAPREAVLTRLTRALEHPEDSTGADRELLQLLWGVRAAPAVLNGRTSLGRWDLMRRIEHLQEVSPTARAARRAHDQMTVAVVG